MADILGPASAANSVTSRPSDDRTFGAQDTWFKDCTGPDIDDGTEFRASWFNGVLAKLRNVWRINGALAADPTTKIVAENEADDFGLSKALQHLLQRDLVRYGVDTGAANALVVSLSPAPPELLPGMVARVKIGHDITGASTLTVNGIGPYPITHPDGSATGQGDGVAGEIAFLEFDGSRWQKVGLSALVLAASRTYYVDAALGDDANDGRQAGAGHAFKTIQKAIDVAAKYNLNGFNINIQVADYVGGNYGPFICTAINGSGGVNITGNIATPANVTVAAASGPAAQGEAGRGYNLQGLKFTAAATDTLGGRPGAGVWSKPGCTIGVSNCELGYCYDAHLDAQGGTIAFGGNIRVSGGCNVHAFANNGGTIYSTGLPLTALNIVNAVTISAFVAASVNAIVIPTYSSITGKANVTGAKFSASMNGVIATNTGDVNYLPGSTAGVADGSTGGRYN